LTTSDGEADEFRVLQAASRLAIFGEVDALTAAELDAAIGRAAGEGVIEVVLDLRGLAFIDSSGLNVLVANAARLQAAGAVLVVEAPSGSTRRLLEISGLDRVLTIRQ
jgi:anti-sigma B factor antagonist